MENQDHFLCFIESEFSNFVRRISQNILNENVPKCCLHGLIEQVLIEIIKDTFLVEYY